MTDSTNERPQIPQIGGERKPQVPSRQAWPRPGTTGESPEIADAQPVSRHNHTSPEPEPGTLNVQIRYGTLGVVVTLPFGRSQFAAWFTAENDPSQPQGQPSAALANTSPVQRRVMRVLLEQALADLDAVEGK